MRCFAIRDFRIAYGSFAALRLALLGASGTAAASIGAMKHLLALSSIVALLGLSAGCAHEDAARGKRADEDPLP
jgi:hypothetical protein